MSQAPAANAWNRITFVLLFLGGSAGMKPHSILAGTVTETILDNGSAGAFGEGNWKASASSQPYGKDALYARNWGNYSFVPQVPAGQYRVYLWWASYKSLADHVPVTVQTAHGTVSMQVNQRENAGTWNLLGTFDLDSSAALCLAVNSRSFVCADAAKFEPVPTSPDPLPDLPPASPTGPVASGLVGSIRLVWNPSTEPDLAGYSVYRSTGASGGFGVLGSQLTTSAYTDAAVAVETMYYYCVTATDAGGNESAASSVVSAKALDPAPAAPAGLSSSGGAASIALDWADNTEPDIAGYSVYRSTSASGGFGLLGSQLTTSAYTDAAVAVGTTYYYCVTATDAGGNESAASSVVSAQLAPLPPPPTSLTLAWVVPATNVDGTALTDLGGFKVCYGSQSGAYTSATDVGNVTEFTFSSFPAGTYYFAVRAYDTSGNESAPSNEVLVTR
jgi:hypothetical protein